MHLKILGAGSAICRHPLITPSFLLQSDDSNIVFGCGSGVPAKLQSIGIELHKIAIWAPLSSRPEQTAGLWEIAYRVLTGEIPSPYLAGPEYLLKSIGLPLALLAAFQVQHTRTIHVNEEHIEETVEFVPNHLGAVDSYGLVLDEAQILITGETSLNEEWLHSHGADTKIILHSCAPTDQVIEGYEQSASIQQLQKLPIYLQKKIWLYGYPNNYRDLEDPYPMLFLPQGQCAFDSTRKVKHLEKERFIRENTLRVMGNERSKLS